MRGASTQFGREFGRAGANKILKGANSYNVNINDYNGRINSTDSDIVKTIKEIKKIKFVTTDKANISRLIDITNIIIPFIVFNELETLYNIKDVETIIDIYNKKYEHGEVLISSNYNGKDLDLLIEKRNYFLTSVKEFNLEIKDYITTEYNRTKKERKTKTKMKKYAIISGIFGGHRYYLGKGKQTSYGILYTILFLSFIIPIILNPLLFFCSPTFLLTIIDIIVFSMMTENKFDKKYNSEYYFFTQFVE